MKVPPWQPVLGRNECRTRAFQSLDVWGDAGQGIRLNTEQHVVDRPDFLRGRVRLNGKPLLPEDSALHAEPG